MTAVLPAEAPVATRPDPVAVAVRLRPHERQAAEDRFAASDLPRGWDLARVPAVGSALQSRHFQFALILPNQIIFWLVILSGLAGTVVPGLNFGTAITWYLWFAMVFVATVVVGRAWCAMCPFGGFAEWIQRRTFWRRTQRALGLGRPVPEPIARYGLVLSVGAFLLLTWIEEFFNIAGPGAPSATSWMVVGIVASAVAFFLVFERRSFCRYFCPLTALIGTVGSMGTAAGFRTRDRDRCITCATKDCMRGGQNGYGCPWYTWPGSSESNMTCGLCSECYKACPAENIGFYVQPPLTSLVAPRRRRADVAWAVALLWGLVVYQQINATNLYGTADDWLNAKLHLPHYPNPVAYLGFIGVLAGATAGLAWVIGRVFARPDLHPVGYGPGWLERTGRFRSFFLPLAYGLIPVVGADYFARQLPKFLENVPKLIPAIGHPFGIGSEHSGLYNHQLTGDHGVVIAQVVVMALGTLAGLWVTWRIAGRELVPISRRRRGVRIASGALVLACGAAAGFLYLIMHAAQ